MGEHSMKQYINYAKAFNANGEVLSWIDTTLRAYHEKNAPVLREVEHIIDYLVSGNAPQRLKKASYAQMKSNAEKWNESLQKRGNGIIEESEDTETIKDFQDGFKIVKLIGENAYKREGALMRHCVESYYGNGKEIYSLRDKNNMPHCTIEKDQQIKGKGNGHIHPKYIDYIIQFLKYTGMEIRDSEMRNIGYHSGASLKNYIHNKLYKEKYLYEAETIRPKKGYVVIRQLSEIDTIQKGKKIVFWGTLRLRGYSHPLPAGFTHCGGYLDLGGYIAVAL
jgi:hypothetical protein